MSMILVPEIVIEALDLGLPVFPVRLTADGQKVPDAAALKTTGHVVPDERRLGEMKGSWKPLQTALPTREHVEMWAQRKPEMWAFTTGAYSRRFTMDFDGKPGLRVMESWDLEPSRRSGSGSYHLDFGHPGWRVKTLNSQSKRELGERWPGLDIRADGGYIVFDGRNAGGEYRQLRPLADVLPISLLPADAAAFFGLLEPPRELQPPAGDAGRMIARPVARSYGGDYEQQSGRTGERPGREKLLEWALRQLGNGEARNNTGFALACQLRDNGYTIDEAAPVMRDYAASVGETNAKGHPEPYRAGEAMASLGQAYSASPREPWKPLAARPAAPRNASLGPAWTAPPPLGISPTSDSTDRPAALPVSEEPSAGLLTKGMDMTSPDPPAALATAARQVVPPTQTTAATGALKFQPGTHVLATADSDLGPRLASLAERIQVVLNAPVRVVSLVELDGMAEAIRQADACVFHVPSADAPTLPPNPARQLDAAGVEWHEMDRPEITGDPDDDATAVLASLEATVTFEGDDRYLAGDYRAEALARQQGATTVYPTGFDAFDEAIGGGIYPGVHTLAGVTGAGKTLIALLIAWLNALAGRPVVYITYEQARRELWDRLIGPRTATPLRELRAGRIDAATSHAAWKQVMAVATHLQILEGDELGASGPWNVARIAAHVRRVKRQTGKSPLVIVDYLQRMPTDAGQDRRLQIDALVTGLQVTLGRRESTPVLVISSVSRGYYGELATDPLEDRLAVFKESGGIEYTSYTATLIYPLGREHAKVLGLEEFPEGDGVTAAKRALAGEPWRYLVLDLVKNREGEADQRWALKWWPASARFELKGRIYPADLTATASRTTTPKTTRRKTRK